MQLLEGMDIKPKARSSSDSNPAFRGFAFAFPLLTFLPVWLRRASQDEVEQPRADAGEAGMPKPF